MSSYLVSDIFATFSHYIKNTTTRSEPTCRCTRTRRSGVMCAEQAACFPCQSWGGCITVCSSLSFRQGPVAALIGALRRAGPDPDSADEDAVARRVVAGLAG